MSYNCRATAPNVLGHAQGGGLNLVAACFSAQLLYHLHDLIEARGPHGMAARLQSSHGTDGDVTLQCDLSLPSQAHTVTPLSEATGLQGKGSRDSEGIVQLEEIEVLRSDPRLLVGFPDRLMGSAEEERVVPVVQGNQVVATLGFEKGDREWGTEDVALVHAIAEQLGLAAETQRLLEATQSRAAREQLTLRIAEQVRDAVDVEEILRVASRSLGRELSASEVVVRLGTEGRLLRAREP